MIRPSIMSDCRRLYQQQPCSSFMVSRRNEGRDGNLALEFGGKFGELSLGLLSTPPQFRRQSARDNRGAVQRRSSAYHRQPSASRHHVGQSKRHLVTRRVNDFGENLRQPFDQAPAQSLIFARQFDQASI